MNNTRYLRAFGITSLSTVLLTLTVMTNTAFGMSFSEAAAGMPLASMIMKLGGAILLVLVVFFFLRRTA